MREAMMNAPVGDDVYDEDPTIHELEARGAELLGQEAALFCVTGSMANLLGIWCDVPRGAEVCCDAQAHIVRAELGAHAVLHGVTTRTWSAPRGVADLDLIASFVALPASHLVGTAAIELENTHNFGGGSIQPLETVAAVSAFAAEHDIALHLDGARMANACVATGHKLADYGSLATTVTLCLSKGLGAPIGTLLASSKENIARARVQRKRLGGGWRQAGILAAAGIYALEHHIDRLADDHRAAALLADEVARRAPQAIATPPETNIVVIDTGKRSSADVIAAAARHDVRISGVGPHTVRAVTHLGVSAEECVAAGQVIGEVLADGSAGEENQGVSA
jgi:threonine aldolase